MCIRDRIAEEYYEIPKDQRNGKVQVVASTSFFVPKPFTPFQWARMSTKEEFLDKARVVNRKMKEMLNHKSLKYNWHEADVTVLEGVLARGDRRVAAVIEEAYRNGALYDAWSESFRNDIDVYKRQGFYHLNGISGNVEETVLKYIVRDHDKEIFESRKAMGHTIADFLNKKYGEGTVVVETSDTYYNMAEKIQMCIRDSLES